jgi:hypothetical protein
MPLAELRQNLVLFFLVERVLTGFLNWALEKSPDTALVSFLQDRLKKMKPVYESLFAGEQTYPFYWNDFEEFLREEAKEAPNQNLPAGWRRSPVEINILRADLEYVRQIRNTAMHGRDPGLRDEYDTILGKVYIIFRKLESYLNANVFAFQAGRALVLSKEELAMLCRGEAIVSEAIIPVANRWQLRFVRAPEGQSWAGKTPGERLQWPAGGRLWVSVVPMEGAGVSEIWPLEALQGAVKKSPLARDGSEPSAGWSLYYPQDWENDLLGLPKWVANNPERPLPYPYILFRA